MDVGVILPGATEVPQDMNALMECIAWYRSRVGGGLNSYSHNGPPHQRSLDILSGAAV